MTQAPAVSSKRKQGDNALVPSSAFLRKMKIIDNLADADDSYTKMKSRRPGGQLNKNKILNRKQQRIRDEIKLKLIIEMK